jgi:hypothetical protein
VGAVDLEDQERRNEDRRSAFCCNSAHGTSFGSALLSTDRTLCISSADLGQNSAKFVGGNTKLYIHDNIYSLLSMLSSELSLSGRLHFVFLQYLKDSTSAFGWRHGKDERMQGYLKYSPM